jgi:uncharacterized protein
MEFKNFSLGLSQTKVARFSEELAAGRIVMTVCKKCGKRYYPPRADCSACMTSEMGWAPIETEGNLVTFTKIYVPPEHFAVRPSLMPFSTARFEPCPIGVLEVKEGLRIMGWMPKTDMKKVQIGMRMKASPEILPNGTVTIVLQAT